ncbi:MAG TPA: dihydrolipoyl dehydrogenase [Bdellovibrionota bacterium]|jgi:dihydrolipoamide dehydrogenase
MAETFDLVIIGAGPGGYVGAVKAAQLGLKTAIVEKDSTLGGTCLNVGCIPSKALLDSSEHFSLAQHDFADHGIEVPTVKLDLAKMMGRKEKIVKDLTKGVAYLMRKHKVTVFEGLGTIKGPNAVSVKNKDGQVTEVQTKNICIATGSVPNSLPSLQFDGKNIISSTEALSLPKVPEHLIIVGGGVIGLELGSVWRRLGSKVTVIEFTDRICGGMDGQASDTLKRILEKQGFTFLMGAKVTGARITGKSVTVSMESRDGQKMGDVNGDVVLVATGRRAYTDGLGLEALGIERDKAGRVVVDEHLRVPKFPSIYAIGDAIAGPMLAHKAEEEGVAVAETIAGKHGHVNYLTVPGIVYTWPEVASVGYTEEQLKEKGVEYKAGKFPFTPNGRAKAMGFTDGFVKILADKKTDRVLGCHIVGPRASDMIAEAVMAMEFGGSAEDIARAFHAHPTLSEVMREAALAVDNLSRQM